MPGAATTLLPEPQVDPQLIIADISNVQALLLKYKKANKANKAKLGGESVYLEFLIEVLINHITSLDYNKKLKQSLEGFLDELRKAQGVCSNNQH